MSILDLNDLNEQPSLYLLNQSRRNESFKQEMHDFNYKDYKDTKNGQNSAR